MFLPSGSAQEEVLNWLVLLSTIKTFLSMVTLFRVLPPLFAFEPGSIWFYFFWDLFLPLARVYIKFPLLSLQLLANEFEIYAEEDLKFAPRADTSKKLSRFPGASGTRSQNLGCLLSSWQLNFCSEDRNVSGLNFLFSGGGNDLLSICYPAPTHRRKPI